MGRDDPKLYSTGIWCQGDEHSRDQWVLIMPMFLECWCLLAIVLLWAFLTSTLMSFVVY